MRILFKEYMKLLSSLIMQDPYLSGLLQMLESGQWGWGVSI